MGSNPAAPTNKINNLAKFRAALEERGRIRELAMFNLAIDSKLRASDLKNENRGNFY
ncbi:MAG TPA: hypothetical protein VN685_06740 [Rhizomicrobium sp.]|nr:hypothetical protein [Rhizomicrobium sp.]